MASLIRAHQWRVSPLGSIENWPQSLKTAVELMLHSRQPAYVSWGRALVTLYNDASISLLGSLHPGVLGKPCSEIWSDNWGEMRPVIEAVMTGEPQHIAGQRVRQSGRDAPAGWYIFSWTPLRDDKGNIAGFYCGATETTLQLADEQLRTVLQNTRDGVNMLDLQSGKYVYMSPAHAALTGFSVEELHNLSATESLQRVHPDDREVSQRQLQRLTDGTETESTAEYRWRVKSGEYRWFSVSRKLVRDPSGLPVALVGVSRDITPQKEAELEVLAGRATLDAALRSMTDAVFIVDANGRSVRLNQAFATFHRFESLDQCYAHVAEYPKLFEGRHPDGRDAPMDEWPVSRALRGETGVGTELLVRRKDTGETWIGSYSFGPIRDQNGKVTGAVVTARDITEAKADEARLQALKDELIHVGRVSELSQVSAGIAHELNQPLSAMLNYSATAKRMIAKMDKGSVESAQRAIEKAGEQAWRAGEIIRRVRDFVERRDTNRRRDTINAIVEEAVALGLIGANADGIITHLDLSVDLPPVFADRVQIQQVLVNLLRNAIDAMSNSSTRELTVATRKHNCGVEVAVSDTGGGIPASIVDRLFQPFVTTKIGGMGIGLAISRSIIESHGGEIAVEAHPGGGTVFRFSLPAAPPAPEAVAGETSVLR